MYGVKILQSPREQDDDETKTVVRSGESGYGRRFEIRNMLDLRQVGQTTGNDATTYDNMLLLVYNVFLAAAEKPVAPGMRENRT